MPQTPQMSARLRRRISDALSEATAHLTGGPRKLQTLRDQAEERHDLPHDREGWRH